VSPRAFRGVLRAGAGRVELDVRLEGDRLVGRWRSRQNWHPVDSRVALTPDGALTLVVDGTPMRFHVARTPDRTWVALEGSSLEVEHEAPGAKPRGAASRDGFAVSPMTGLVAKMAVAPGQKVPAGTALFVVEAMKMEYAVKAPRDVVVAEVRRKAGEKVALGEVVVTFAAEKA
jgi:acetyl/propionyl-CoA carboxylase alpha subunit